MKAIRRYLSGAVLAVLLVTLPVNFPVPAMNHTNAFTIVQAAVVKLNKTKVTLQVGGQYTLKLSQGVKNVTWSSDNEEVAVVTSKGKVTGVGSGKATITAKAGTKKYKCTITVKETKLTAEEVYKKCSASTVQINTDIAIGSGFFIEKNKIVTNYHVIAGASSISVQLQNGKEYKVSTVLGYDKNLDIAILKVSVAGTPLKINQHGIKIGEAVYAIGSSLGFADTFTDGIVTNAKRVIDNVSYIQTNAAITNGNSGGPLLNGYGEVMGINSMYAEGGQNLNFAINVGQVASVSMDTPMSVAKFYNTNKGASDDTSDDTSGSTTDEDTSSGSDISNYIMYEDTTKSNNRNLCQTIQSGYYMYGSISPDNLDYYNFTLTSQSKVYLIGSPITSNLSDIGYLYFAIYNAQDDLVAVTSLDTTNKGQVLDLAQTLDAGTYYIVVLSDSNYVTHDIPYIFTLSYY